MEPDKELWVGTVEELKRKLLLEHWRTHDYGLRIKYCCHVCGKPFEPTELVVLMDFSFCGEYNCGLMMHLKCPRIEALVKMETYKPSKIEAAGTASDMRRWHTCTCWRDGIRHSCFRPEYWSAEDFKGTASSWPCLSDPMHRMPFDSDDEGL